MADVLDVWLDGRFAGQLFRGETDQVEFIYDEGYQADRASTPLSWSMPTASLGHGPDVVMPWLSNLLPDAEEVRARWAAKFNERRTDPFTLLAHMGEDAPGSVQVVPLGAVPSDLGSLSKLTDDDIARRVNAILDDPDSWVDDSDADESRFSLGGNQGKFALARIDGEWFEPNGRAPSTHIIKPGMVLASGRTDAHVQAVEFVTMRAARSLGVTTATVEILDFAGVQTFVTTRYDRRATPDGHVTRVHQEDFCQALGVYPARKYEEDGGPTMADMVKLVGTASSLTYRHRDLDTLTRLFAFNLLAAAPDAHAKNHSLMHLGKVTRLAPAYDLISAHGLWDENRVEFKASAAVKYGKERQYRAFSARNLARTADVLDIDRHEAVELIETMADDLPAVFDAAVRNLPDDLVDDRVAAMPARAEHFAADLVRRLKGADLSLSTLPRFQGGSNVQAASLTRTWEQGHWSSGRWVTGRYRGRSSSQ